MKFIKIASFVILKDISIFLVYFIVLKYNLTQETYTEEMIGNFPGAPNMTLASMIGVTIFFLWWLIPIDILLITFLYPFLNNLLKRAKYFLLYEGIILHLPFMLFWLAMYFFRSITTNNASIIAYIFSLIIGGLAWILLSGHKIKSGNDIQIASR